MAIVNLPTTIFNPLPFVEFQIAHYEKRFKEVKDNDKARRFLRAELYRLRNSLNNYYN